MINMFSHMACICHFVFMPSPEPPIGISGVVHSQCSLEVLKYFFQFFRCRNLALSRVFPTFLEVGMFLYLGGVWMPYICMPPVHLYLPIHLYICSQRLLHVVRVVSGPLTCGTLPLHLLLYGSASLQLHPLLSCWLPYASVGFRDIGMSYGEISLLLALGVFPSIGGAGRHQHM